jgi:hypothetical protein
MFKIILTLTAAVLAAILAAKFTFNATAHAGSESANQPWAQDRMEFVAWNGEKWTAWVRAGLFEQLPQNTQKWSRHANASIAYTDWEGRLWQAKIDGEEFLLAQRGDWGGTVERAAAIKYRDWTGKNQLRTVAQLRRWSGFLNPAS